MEHLDQLRRLRSVVGAALLVASMAGCTYTPPTPPAPIPVESQASSPSATPTPTVAVAVLPIGEKVLGQLSSQRGSAQIGPFPRTTDRLAVYVVCKGAGEMNVAIPGVGSFPLECDPSGSDEGIKNVFDVRYVSTLTISGQGDGSVVWGLTATAIS